MAAPDERPSGGLTTVVVVDDEAIIRMSMRAILTDVGYEVVGEASDGQEAVDLAREIRPDIVIMDIRMPGMDGVTAARILTEEQVAPVLLVTGYSQEELAEQARKAGVAGYVAKPFSESDLVAAVEGALAAGRELRALVQEVGGLPQALEARKMVAWARGILMASQGLSEAEATRAIQQMSASTGKPIIAVSEDIVFGRYAQPPGADG